MPSPFSIKQYMRCDCVNYTTSEEIEYVLYIVYNTCPPQTYKERLDDFTLLVAAGLIWQKESYRMINFSKIVVGLVDLWP